MNLEELRKQIDEIDSEMMILFKKRMSVSLQIGEYKRANNVPILDASREFEMMFKKKKELKEILVCGVESKEAKKGFATGLVIAEGANHARDVAKFEDEGRAWSILYKKISICYQFAANASKR